MAKIISTEVIRISAYITEREGYVKRSDSAKECTADKVIDAIETNAIDEEELAETKERVAEWFNYINDPKQQGEYFDDLRSVITKPTIEESKIGLIASSFASFDRYKKYKAVDNINKKSQFLGEEGDSIIFNIESYQLVKSGTSKFGNNAKWYLYRIKDDNGNIITWFADHDCTFEFSNSKQASATITKLSTYNEVKQTNVSKLKFM
jgi:hypothetical protein